MTAFAKPSGAAGRILDLVKDIGEPLTVGQMAEKLRESYDTVSKAVQRLRNSYLLMPCGFRPKAAGRPEILYTSTELVSSLTGSLAEDADRETFYKDAEGKVSAVDTVAIDAIAKSLLDQFDPSERERIKRALEQAYIRLADEDPVKLLLSMAEWVVSEFEDALRDFASATAAKAKEKAERSDKRIRLISKFGFDIFNKTLGVPGEEIYGPFRVGLDYSTKKVEREIKQNVSPDTLIGELVVFNKPELEKHLRRHVYGSNFFEKVPASPPTSYAVVGTDASFGSIVVNLGRFGFLEPINAALNTAVAAWYGVDGEKGVSELDPYPDPTTWTKFPTEQAIRGGYLVPPEVAMEVPHPLWKRVLEASMNLRHYVKDKATMRAALSGRPSIEKAPLIRSELVSAIVRDGRIFPYEHTVDDFQNRPPHGSYVRQSLAAFSELVDAINSNKEMLYCGAVKWSHVEIFARIIFWYLKYGSAPKGKQIWKNGDEKYDEEYIFGHVATDQMIVKHAFETLSKKMAPKSGERWCTFRSLRRFYSISDERSLCLKRLDVDESGWIDEITRIVNRQPAIWREEINPRLYALLCARAALLVFYVMPSPSLPEDLGGLLQLPRLEILVPYSALQNPTELRELDRKYIRQLAEIVADKRMIDIYSLRERYQKEIYLIFLKPVRFAHEFAKGYAQDSRRQVFGLLIQRVSEFVRAKGLIGRPGTQEGPK